MRARRRVERETDLSEPGSAYRLSVLEERWRSDRSPRVFLQLADELRRAGRPGRAVEVLRDGLEGHPESVSGWVAFGRVLLDEGEPGAAIAAFDRALERDPGQVVACKLLTESWIRVGDPVRAAASLERARLLSLPDADLEQLTRELEVLRGELSAAGGPLAVAAIAPPAAPMGSEPFDLRPPVTLPALDFERLGSGRRAWRRVAIATEPFAGLLAGSPPAGRFEAALREPGIFGDASAPPAPAALDFAPVEPPAVPVAIPDEAIFRPTSIGEEVERETAFGAGEPQAPAATATLAALYLAQGHLNEAEHEYRRVLTERAGDAEALAGLEQVARRRDELALPSGLPDVAVPPPGLTARRLRRLRGFYDQLRAERRRDRVRVS
jgi:tetratricopeptide (TPR) repeat protein